MLKKVFLTALLITAAVWLGAASYKAAILCDVHVAPGNDNEAALVRTVEEINAGGFDLALVPGDLTNTGSDAELAAVKAVLDKLSIPYYAVTGNHETNWSESAAMRFNELFGTERFYCRVGKILFIGFGSGPYLKMGDGHVRNEDVAWLRDTLAREAGPDTMVVVTVHYPLEKELSNWHDVAEILKQYHTKLVISGHWHQMRPLRLNGLDTLISRSLSMRGNYGYGVLEWSDHGDFALYEKPLGGEAMPVSFEDCEVIEQEAEAADPLPSFITLVLRDAASIFTGVAVLNGKIFYANSAGVLKACDPAGKVLWSWKGDFSIYSTPVAADGITVWGIAGKRLIAAYNANTGVRMWQVGTGTHPPVNTGAISDGALYIGLGARDFAKFDLKTGKELWRWSGAGGIFQARPAVNFDTVVTGAWDGHLYALDSATGEELWNWNNGRPEQRLLSPGNVAPVIANRRCYIVAPDRYMTAFDLVSGDVLWRDNSYKYRESLGVSADGNTVYAKTMDGELVAVATTGSDFEVRWVADLGFGYEHNPCPNLEYDGRVYAGSRSGRVAAVDAATGELLYSIKLGNSSINGFAAGDGAVWCSLVEGTIFRIGRE